MRFSRWENFLVVFIMAEVLVAGVSFNLKDIIHFNNKAVAISNNLVAAVSSAPVYVPPQKLSNPPEIVKAVYVTGYSAGTKKYLNYLTNLFKNTEINSVVVDIKGSDGYVSYDSGAADVKKYKLSDYAISDIDALIKFFHDQNIYVIGRIAVFEDPVYSKARPELAIYNKLKTTDTSQPILWQDNNGLSWLDPSSKDVWDYDISLAKDAFYHGFDEVNFDYVRFPTDGKKDTMGFPVWDQSTLMSGVIKNFFSYIRQQLAGEKISVDLFGQTTTNTDDMGIGQVIENTFENFDYVSPMVYPSHYANNFLGFSNPAEHPYEIIKYAMSTAQTREDTFSSQEQDAALKNNQNTGSKTSDLQSSVPTPAIVPLAKFRPWIQDFNMGADYTASMVESEIKATEDALGNNFSGFMLWNPSNIYTQDAVKSNSLTPAQ